MKLYRVNLIICEGCLAGEGEMCSTPGCALFMHAVDIPIEVAQEDKELIKSEEVQE